MSINNTHNVLSTLLTVDEKIECDDLQILCLVKYTRKTRYLIIKWILDCLYIFTNFK